jgi:acyl-CoA reductase-like NAD-dependent aldehyde dehydrogenase
MTELIQLDALGATGPYRTRNRLTVTDLAGTPGAELSLVPPLFVRRTLDAQRAASTMPADQRAAALVRAGMAFAAAAIDGLSVAAYQHTVSRVSGMPISVVRATTSAIAQSAAEAYWSTRYAQPAGALDDWRDPLTRTGRALWARRGDVFAVHAAGNHPAVHTLWLEALALGYRVAVRPSQREPFTPHRMIVALREAGFTDDQVVLLPTDHSTAGDIIRNADLAMVYGGDDVVDTYRNVATVLPQGPGRSKILLTGNDWESHLDTIVDSVSAYGGTACINATAVLVEGDPSPVAEAIAERLSAIPSLPPEDEKAVLPAQSLAAAHAIEKYLLAHAGDAKALLGGDGVTDDLGDGSAVLRPAVFQVDRSNAPQTGIEMSFPCVWVAPWSRSEGIEPLKNTLALTAITQDEQLIDLLADEPSIRNVYIGDHSTHWMAPWVPHDGYLAEFLMRTKGIIRG